MIRYLVLFLPRRKSILTIKTKKMQTVGIDKRNALFLKPRKQGQSLTLLCYSEMPKSKNEYR